MFETGALTLSGDCSMRRDHRGRAALHAESGILVPSPRWLRASARGAATVGVQGAPNAGHRLICTRRACECNRRRVAAPKSETSARSTSRGGDPLRVCNFQDAPQRCGGHARSLAHSTKAARNPSRSGSRRQSNTRRHGHSAETPAASLAVPTCRRLQRGTCHPT